MKSNFLIYFLFLSFICYSQNDIYILKDSTNTVSLENLEAQKLKLSTNKISDESKEYTYWFKIPASKTKTNYIFRLRKKKYDVLNAYQDSKKIEKMSNQRQHSFVFSRESPVYIQFKPKYQNNFRVELLPLEESVFKEKKQLIINSMYYGFAFVIIIYNLIYFYLLKDDSFLYYSSFLFFIAFSFFILDGMLYFYGFNNKVDILLTLLCYIAIAFFSSKFANSYLLLDINYPKHKKYAYGIGILIILLAFVFYFTNNFIFYKLISLLVFSLLITYWIFGLILFNRNIFIKIFVFAYALILFAAIDFFVLRILGISTGLVNDVNIKIGSILEMVIISFAVLYRVRELKLENEQMYLEIVNYSKLNSSTNKSNVIDNLSLREHDIFNLIIEGNSNKEIANQLNISINTVKFHIKNIYDKLDISSRKEVFKINKTSI